METLLRRNLGTKSVIIVLSWIKMTVRYIKHYGKKGKTIRSLEIKTERIFLK